MKKVLIVILILFLVSGCNKTNKSITCTKTETNNGVEQQSKIKLEFKDDETTKVIITTIYDLGKYSTYIDSFVASLEEETKLYSEESGFEAHATKTSDSKIEAKQEFDFQKVSETIKRAYNLDSIKTYESSKDYWEHLGYKCKK